MSRYNEILQKVKWESLQSYLNGDSELPGDSKEKAAKLYAEECVKASLEEAADNAECCYDATVKKESITNPENIILL